MADSCRGRSSKFKIDGKSKPFVDNNLQFQFPGCDSQKDEFFSPIKPYTQFFSAIQSSYEMINETEIYQAMKEAEHAYEAWKQMQVHLKEAVKNISDS